MLMSLVGLGRAFNLKYRPYTPLQTNCYHRQMPIMFGGDRNVSITENYKIETTPGGLWGAVMGFSEGWATGGFFANSIMCLLERLGYKAKTQGETDSAATGNSSKLKDLQDLFKSKGAIIKETSPGKFTATIDGKSIGKDLSYDEMYDALDNYNKEKKVEKDNNDDGAVSDTPEAKAKVHDPALTKNDNGEWVDKEGNEYEWDDKNKQFNPTKKDKSLKAQDDGGPEPSSKVSGGRKTQGSKRSGGARGAKGAKETKETKNVDENAYKNKPYNVKISIHYNWEFNTCKYTATGSFTDDKGQKHDINLPHQVVEVGSWSFSSEHADKAIAKDIGPKLKAKAKELGFPNLHFIYPKDIDKQRAGRW